MKAEEALPLEEALAVLYGRLGFASAPQAVEVGSPLRLLPRSLEPPNAAASLTVLERHMASAIAEGLTKLGAAGGRDPAAPETGLSVGDSSTATAFTGHRMRRFTEGTWGRGRGSPRLSVSQMVMAEIGWWRDEVLGLAELAIVEPKEDTPEAARTRAAIAALRLRLSFAVLAPARAFVVPHPKVAYLDGVPHRDGGRAVTFPDGWGLYALHGVNVPDWLAVTPAEQLDPRRLTELPNAEHRREFVRKVGVERICSAFAAKVVDRQTFKVGDLVTAYELLVLDLGDARRRPYLKMRNPSVPGLYHLEGVPPDVRTVQEAINWRAHRDKRKHWQPEVLT